MTRIQDQWEQALRRVDRLGRLGALALETGDRADPLVLEVVADLLTTCAAILGMTPTPADELIFTQRVATLDRELSAVFRDRAQALSETPLPFLREYQPDRLAALDERERLWRAEMVTLA